MSEKPNIILLGGGGHCMAVMDVIEQENKYNILGFLDPDESISELLSYPRLGSDNELKQYVKPNHYFLITVGQIKSYQVRERLCLNVDSLGGQWARVISPKAYVSPHAEIKDGTVIMHGAIIGPKAKIGKQCIVNTLSNVEHGSIIEDFCHISTGAMVNGDCKVGRGSFIGSNACLSHGLHVPKDSIISAGKFVKQ